MLNIGVLISGGGTNLQAIIDETKSGGINGTVKLVISNKENAYGLERARLSGIKAVYETNEDKIIGLLKENNIDLNDLTIDTSVDFASMAGTFIGGVGDFVTLFEPSATQVEQKGYGYVVGYIGEYGGSVPYTAYNARKSYISENKDTIQKFTNAINKGLDFVWNNDEETVAKVIVNQFPDLTINELSKMIKRYKVNEIEKIAQILKNNGIIN